MNTQEGPQKLKIMLLWDTVIPLLEMPMQGK